MTLHPKRPRDPNQLGKLLGHQFERLKSLGGCTKSAMARLYLRLTDTIERSLFGFKALCCTQLHC
jgi:hypothetical protein